MNSTALQTEARFSDRQYAAFQDDRQINQTMLRKYAVPSNWWDWRDWTAKLMGNLTGKSLLDYGCGMGEEAVYFATLGAKVTGIDVSPVGIELTRQRAEYNGLTDRIDAMVMDATHTSFPDCHFDVVHGLGILHHVGLLEGLAEVRRVLKPGGEAFFLEPMGNIRLIEACKSWLHRRIGKTWNLTEVNDREQNLRSRDVGACVRQFTYAATYPYHLTYRVRKLLCPAALHTALKRLDYQLLRFGPFLKVFAGALVIHLRK